MPSNLTRLHLGTCRAALALMMTVPFLMPHHYNPIPSFFQEWTSIALGLVAVTALLVSPGKQPLAIPEITFLPLGLLVIAILQSILQPDPLTGRLVLFGSYMVWAAFLVITGRHLAQISGQGKIVRLLAAAILVGACLEAGSGILQLSGQAGLPWFFPFTGGGLKGNLAQNNNFADYLWLGIASALYLRSRHALSTASTAAVLTLLIPIAILSGSRSIWLYGVSIVLLSLLWGKHGSEGKMLRAWSAFALLASLLCQLVLSSDLFQAVLMDIATAGGRVVAHGSYDSNRLALWRIAIEIFMEHPWLGAGIGHFTSQFQLHIFDAQSWRLGLLPEHAHNILFHLLAEMGLAAGALLVIFCSRWLIDLAKSPKDPETWWAWAVALVLCIHSGLEYPLWYAFFLGIAALLAGATSQGSRVVASGRTTRLVLLFLIGGAAWNLHGLFRDYSLLEDSLNGRITAKSATDAQSQKMATLQQLSANTMLRHHADFAKAHLLTENTEDLPAKLEICDHAQRFSAAQSIVFKCALLLSLAGKESDAKQALRRAAAAYPQRALLTRDEWQKRAALEPAIAHLITEFPNPPGPSR